MSTPSAYLTVAGPAQAEVEVKRSRFVCDLAPARSEEAARSFIESVRAGSREARHHCTAFVIGPDAAVQRSNDDGEPSGTAGAPMLEVLRGRALSDVVAVVTRWFGGTLLGTGGLIRAYGDAVAAAVDSAADATLLVRRERRLVRVLTVSHAEGARVEHALRSWGVDLPSVEWTGDGVSLTLAFAPDLLAATRAAVAELTSGMGVLVPRGDDWVDAPLDEQIHGRE